MYASDNPITRMEAENESKLQAAQDYNNQYISNMVQAGYDEESIIAASTQLANDYEEKKLRYKQQVKNAELQITATTLGGIAQGLQDLYVLTGSKNQAMFTAYKAVAIAQTAISTYVGAQAAFTSAANIPYVGWILCWVAAAAAIVSGIARINQIRSMQPGGGSVSSTGGSAPSMSASMPSSATSGLPGQLEKKEETKPTQNITVQIHNPLSTQNWDKIAEDNIIPALNAAQNRNIKLEITNKE
jgi:hypothetical protein